MAQKNKKLSPLAYKVALRLEALRSQKILVAFSGGRDSAVLLSLLLEMRDRLELEVAVAHVHHGEAGTEQKRYRELALAFAKQTAEKLVLPFFSVKANSNKIQDPELTKNDESEASHRKKRALLLEKLRAENQFDWIAYGHHAQDLFETRLIRLIRGTGLGGIEAMSLKRGKKLRPLLAHWPEDFDHYVHANDIQFVNDPSNQDEKYLRNWLRYHWVEDLEKKRPGSMKAFARSLELLAQVGITSEVRSKAKHEKVLDREEFRKLDPVRKRQMLADLLKNIGAHHYSLNMIQEVMKRLDTVQRQLKFIVAGCEWQTNAKQITVRLSGAPGK